MGKQSNIEDFTDDDKVQSSLSFWNYTDNPELIGVFNRWEEDQYSQHAVLIVDNVETHLPNLTALTGKLKAGLVKKDDKVKLIYIGEEKAKSGRVFKNFDVFIKSSKD